MSTADFVLPIDYFLFGLIDLATNFPGRRHIGNTRFGKRSVQTSMKVQDKMDEQDVFIPHESFY